VPGAKWLGSVNVILHRRVPNQDNDGRDQTVERVEHQVYTVLVVRAIGV